MRAPEGRQEGRRVPGWPELLSYYRAAVRAETGALPLLDLRSGGHVGMPGRERVLVGDVDEDGCIPLPAGTGDLGLVDIGAQLWAGWPAVVLLSGGRERRLRPSVAPLLMRQVEVVEFGSGPRLRPIGGVVAHPGLIAALLGEDEAAWLAATYHPTWRPGEYARMAEDARLLLQDLAIPIVDDLRPDDLAPETDHATPIEGARNVAVLFGVDLTEEIATRKLLADIGDMIHRTPAIEQTALAALLDESGGPPVDVTPTLVTPARMTAAQREVLVRAMTQRLTVATAPPGTGKSDLVVNAVATAVANGQRVLVASTNTRAVDDVWERCEKLMSGLLIRTGSVTRRRDEAAGLEALTGITPSPNSHEATCIAFRDALRKHATVETHLWEAAFRERRLLALGRARRAAEERLGRTVGTLARTVGKRWKRRARAAMRAPRWAFGDFRRRRLLDRAGITAHDDDPARLCAVLVNLAMIDDEWQELRTESPNHPSDKDVARMIDSVEQHVQDASTSLTISVVQQGATAGRDDIRGLLRVRRNGESDWGQMRKVLRHVRGWAVSSLEARRFPLVANLFDLVIIDEASQCSVAAALPLLYRARRALVIGDAMQLPHISALSPETDDELRRRHDIPKEWLTAHRLSAHRHSVLAAAAHVADETLLLDEHDRCHPEIVAIPNRLFYQGQLVVLTDLREVAESPVTWRHVTGRAERGPNGTSWRNQPEADEAVRCVHELLQAAPSATIAVVTPYEAQAAEIRHRLAGIGERVRVGPAHAFRCGERDVVIMSLVAAPGVPSRFFDWADQQRELWNVAITRARAQLIVVGDETVWERRGGVGRELLVAARAPGLTEPPRARDLVDRLYSALSAAPDVTFDRDVNVRGQRADALIRRDGVNLPVVVDPGPALRVAPEAHLHRMLRSRMLLGDAAVRIPGWQLLDERQDVVENVLRRAAR